MATIKDVAREAEVSVATVSRVINNVGYVNEDTRKKVESAISKLNYKPNAVARSLFKKQSKTIALIVPDIKNPFFPELARAIEDFLNSKEFTLILCNSDENEDKERKYLEVMKQKYVDGIIIVTSTLTPKHVEENGIPIVALDRPIEKHIPFVTANNFEGARQAVQCLKSQGCQKIAHIRGPENVNSAEQRLKGYLAEVGQESWFSEDFIVAGNFNVLQTTEVTKNLLLKHPDVDGIFAGNDYMAAGVIKAALQMGYKVPEDLAVIGFDDISLCKLTSPEISTMAQPIYEMGYTAAKLLLDMIEGRKVEKMHNEFEVRFIERQSTRIMR